jgi:hypothetical protein
MAEDVEVRFGATLEGFNAGVASVKEKLEALTGPISELQENFAGIGEAMIAAVDFAKEMAEVGEQAVRTSEMLGMTTEAVTALQFASTVTGGSGEKMTSMLERLSRTMAAAAEGGKSQIAAFKEAGVAYEDANGHLRPLSDMLADLADRFKDAPNGPEKTALAIALMGRSGAEAIPMLNLGAEGLSDLTKEAEAAGVVLTGPVADGMARTAENNNKLGQAFQGLGTMLFQIFEPAINGIVTAMTSWVEELSHSLDNSALLKSAVELLAFAFDGVVAVIEILVTAFQELWMVGEGVIAGLSRGLQDLAHAMQDAATLHWTSIGGDLNDAWQHQVDNAKTTVKTMGDLANDMEANITKMFKAQISGNAADPNSSGSPDDRNKGTPFKPPATGGAGGAGNTDALDAAKAKIAGEIAVLTEGLSRKQALLNSELQMHQITEQQWLQQSEAAANGEYQAEVALLQKELQLSGLKLTQRQELLNKLKELEQKHATDIQKIQQKAAQDTAKTWDGVANSISSAINGQISSLLKGTQSLGTALENIGLSLATTMIENAIKSITASAAQSFAGIFAFLSPTMGPAAAVPAAAGQAAVMAAGSGLQGFEVGTWSLPSDSPIMAHKGEMIAPAFESGKIRAMAEAFQNGQLGGGGSGGDHYHTHNWNGPVMDKAGLARTVAEMFDRNPSLRPAYR